MSHEHTSVPRWPAAAAGVDPKGTGYVVVAAGQAGASVATDWISEIESTAKPVRSRLLEAPDPAASAAALTGALADATVGVRVMIAGPELVVLDCVRAARAAGAVDAELTTHVTDTARKRVFCAHCRTCTEADVAVEGRLTCAGCERELVVYHHLSRHHAAYFAFMADAEAPPA